MEPHTLTDRHRAILGYIDESVRDRGFPPSIREIGDAVGLTSPSTVHLHLQRLERLGYLERDPAKPRALRIRFETGSFTQADRRPTTHVPLVGDVAAGTDVLAQENVEEIVPMPQDMTGEGELFMLRVRGDSMIDVGILDGDFVVVNSQPTASNGDIVVAGIPGEEATVKTFTKQGRTITLQPSNKAMEAMKFPADEVTVFGKVVTVMRRL